MYYAADKRTADRVLADLRNARRADGAATLTILQRIRNEAACERSHDHLRMQAWLSIRRLYDAFKAAPEQDLGALWQDAISCALAWRASLR